MRMHQPAVVMMAALLSPLWAEAQQCANGTCRGDSSPSTASHTSEFGRDAVPSRSSYGTNWQRYDAPGYDRSYAAGYDGSYGRGEAGFGSRRPVSSRWLRTQFGSTPRLPAYGAGTGGCNSGYDTPPRPSGRGIEAPLPPLAGQPRGRSYRRSRFEPNGSADPYFDTRDDYRDGFPVRRQYDRFGDASSSVAPRPLQIQWRDDLRTASRHVQQVRQPMLVSVTADWCSYCQRMKAETFTDPLVVRDLATGWVAVRVDADANRDLIRQLGVQSLPTTLVVSPDLQVLERMQGFRSAQQLSQSLRRHARSAERDVDLKVAAR